jgi:hypothetical protein
MDYINNIWNWGLDEARVRQYDMHIAPSWDAEDRADTFDDRNHYVRSELRWVGHNEATDLRERLYGDDVLCYCGCGELFPEAGGLYDTWDFDHGADHLSWLLAQ